MNPWLWVLLYLVPGLLASRPIAHAVKAGFRCRRCGDGEARYCNRHVLSPGGYLAHGWPQALAASMFTLVAWPLTLYFLWLLAPEVRPSRIKQLRRKAELEKLRAENDRMEKGL